MMYVFVLFVVALVTTALTCIFHFLKKKTILNVKVKSITVGKGDCFFLCLEKGGESYNIMIDCMKFNDKVKEMVEVTLKKHIDLLIITHIDNDHVPGLTTMLNTVKDIVVDEIWFNCYQREPESPAQELSEKQKQRLLELKKNIPIVVDVLEGKVDTNDARLLSEAILDYEKRIGKKVWKREYITDEHQDVSIGKNGMWGNIHFLSPSKDAIAKLDKEFRKMFRNLFFDKHETPLVDDVSIYELMILYLQQKQEVLMCGDKIDSKDSFSEHDFRKQIDIEEEESRIENIASIAFVWSYNNHQVLFAGDASHHQVYNRLKKECENKPIVYDAIKVSHHGSNTGTSKALLELIDSSEYFIPCGTNKTPSMPTLAKIVDRQLPNGIECRKIRYNKATENIRLLLNNSKGYSNIPKFELTDETEFIFTC